MRQTKHFTLTPEQRQIVNDYIPFADAIASTFYNRPVDMDDLKQEAYLSLCYAVTTYKGINNATFETFLSKYIKGNLKHFIKHYSRTQILSFDDDEDDCPVQTEHAPSLPDRPAPSLPDRPATSLPDKCCVQTEHAPSLPDRHAPSLTDTLNVAPQVITTTSLSKYDDDEGNLSFEETLPDPDSLESENQLNYKLLADRLLSILTDRERKMVKCAFYIDRQSQIRLRIWERFNLNKSRFYDIVDRAVLKMAEYAHNNHIESPFN